MWLRVKWWLEDHKWGVLQTTWFVILAIVLTYPMILYPNYAALGSPRADGMKHLWTLWWMRSSVWEYGDFPYQTDLVNYPIGMDLYPIEPLNGLVDHIGKMVSILDILSAGSCAAGGKRLFGEDGSSRWSEIWRVAALLNASRALRDMDVPHPRWALSGATAREKLPSVLGPAPWAPAPERAADGSSAALLAAGWLRVLPLDTPELRETIEFLSNVLHHNGKSIVVSEKSHFQQLQQTRIPMWLFNRHSPLAQVYP